MNTRKGGGNVAEDVAAKLGGYQYQASDVPVGSHGASFGSSDPDGYDTLLPPLIDPGAVQADLDVQAQAMAAQLEDDAMIRREASRAKVPEQVMRVLRSMDPERYAEILGLRSLDDEAVLNFTEELGRGQVMGKNNEDDGSYLITAIDASDAARWTYLWDAPGPDGVVRGTSRILRHEVTYKLRSGSHTHSPMGRLPRRPDGKCPMRGQGGVPCIYKFHSEDAWGEPTTELRDHMEAKHPTQLRALERKQNQEAQQAQVSAAQEAALASREAARASALQADMMMEFIREMRASREVPVAAGA